MTGTGGGVRALDLARDPGGEGPDAEDARVAARVAAGHALAFDVLVLRYGDRLRDYLRSLLGGEAFADDLAQEALAKALASLLKGERPRSFRLWLFRIARNEATDHLRRRGVHREAITALEQRLRALAGRLGARRAATPLGALTDREIRARLDRALAGMPEELRTVFLLREREDMSYEEIAEVTGIPAKTVSTRLFRARQRLRLELRDLLGDGDGPREASP